jgi:hypothetical protein
VVIDIYDILQSKDDKATVPIYYEARLAKIDLKPEERPKIDPNFEEVTEDAEESTKESLRRKWAQLEAMVGTDKRIALVAEDLVKHWEARYAAMESASSSPHSPQIRLSAEQAGQGNTDCFGSGRIALCGVGGIGSVGAELFSKSAGITAEQRLRST